MQNTDTSPKTKREFRSLSDIVAYKQQLREKFHKEEEEPRNRAQKLARMVSLGTGVFDGALLGWKLYRRYQEGAFLFGNFGKKKKRK